MAVGAENEFETGVMNVQHWTLLPVVTVNPFGHSASVLCIEQVSLTQDQFRSMSLYTPLSLLPAEFASLKKKILVIFLPSLQFFCLAVQTCGVPDVPSEVRPKGGTSRVGSVNFLDSAVCS